MATLTIAAAVLGGILLTSLWTVSVIGWVRTGALRRGVRSHRDGRHGLHRTSRTTYLPGAVGALLFVAGVSGAVEGLGARAIGIAIVGAAVAGAGFAGRVTALEAGPDGFVVHYGGRRSFGLAWDQLASLIPPRWPLGGWRLTGESASRVLMPSDLLGHEHVLEEVIGRAPLRYKDGAWRQP